MEEYYIYSLFIGDDARYDYIADVCRNRSLRGGWKKTDMKFVYGTAYSEKEGDGMMYITSPFVPPGCCYFFPKDGMTGGVKHPKEYRAVYIFEEFPYGKGTVSGLLGEEEACSDGAVGQLAGRVRRYNSVVVLYWKNRRFGIDNTEPVRDVPAGRPPEFSKEKGYPKEELLENAKKKYKGKCAEVLVYDETDLNRHMVFAEKRLEYGLVKRIRYQYHRNFEEGYQKFASNFRADYGRDIEGELIEYTEKNIKLLEIFNYSNAKKAKGSLWKFFVESYKRELFCDTLRDEIENLCDRYLEDIYSYQHVSEVSNYIYDEWEKAYKLAFMNPSFLKDESMFRKIMVEKVPDNKIEYEKMVGEGNVISAFKKQMNRFWAKGGKAEEICYHIIYKEFSKLRDALCLANGV